MSQIESRQFRAFSARRILFTSYLGRCPKLLHCAPLALQIGTPDRSDERLAILCTEDQMNEDRRQRLGHVWVVTYQFIPRFQALENSERIYIFLGRCPRLLYRAPLALESKDLHCRGAFACTPSIYVCQRMVNEDRGSRRGHEEAMLKSFR